MGSFLVQSSPRLSIAHEGPSAELLNLAGMGRHLLARPEWKNSQEGGGVRAVFSMSLVRSVLMCIPEPASKAQIQSSSLLLVSRACEIPGLHFHQAIYLGCVRVVLAVPQMCNICCGQAAKGSKPLGRLPEWGGLTGQPSPQDLRPLQCLLLKYPQFQRFKNK